MSMPGDLHSRPEQIIAGLARSAHRQRRSGRLDRAAQLAAEALDAAGRVLDATHPQRPAWQAELQALALGIAVDGGRFDAVVAGADAALDALACSATPDPPAAALAGARLHLEAARVLVMKGDAAAAQARLRLALAAPERQTLEGEPGALVRIRAQVTLGAVLCMHGEHNQGQQVLMQAAADAAPLSSRQAGSERTRILLSLSASCFEQFRLDAARQWIEQAFVELTPLARAGRLGALADLGRAWHNLGSIESRAGRLGEAVSAYEEALDVYRRAMRHAARRGDATRLRASRANTSMNLGYTCFKRGEHEKAQRWLSRALRHYGTLLGPNPHLRTDAARAAINAAHLALHRGEPTQAAALYRRSLQTLGASASQPAQLQGAGDRANAHLGLARAELNAGRAASSVAHLQQGLSLLRDLTLQGRLHLANAWLRGWTALATALAAGGVPLRARGRVVAALVAALRSPPLRAAGGNEEPLRVLHEALAAVAQWLQTQAGKPQRERLIDQLADAGMGHLLDVTAELLAQSSPQWLARHEEAVRVWVARLGVTALMHPGAATLLARWFLSTRGLRGQRIAEAALGGQRLSALHHNLQEMGRIEADLLAEAGPPPGAWGDELLPALGAAGSAPAAAGESATRWQALRSLVDAQRGQAVRDGLLPAASHWDVAGLAGLLHAGEALVLVARLDEARLVAVVVSSAVQGRPCVQSCIGKLPAHLLRASIDDIVGAASRAMRADFARADTRQAKASRVLDLQAAARPSDDDARALATLGELAECALGPLLDSLREAASCSRIVVVPADDLHLLPWRRLLRARSRLLQVQVQPTVGAWARSRIAPAPAQAAWPHWTTVTAAGHPAIDALRWVAVEQRAAAQLWREVGCQPRPWQPSAGLPADHDALLVMGHGSAPRGYVAPAGLQLEDGRVLSAHDLGAGVAGGFERVLLSACVSAGTHSAFGEPLGFLSTCFDYRTRFGIGWLIEVPDAAACLFSLAFQFALRQAIAAGGAVVWGEIFDTTCDAIEAGRWPAGFAAWMDSACRVDGAGLPAPPQSLRRVLPWVVAMGQ